MSEKKKAPAETEEQVQTTEAEAITEAGKQEKPAVKPGDELVEYTAPLLPGATKRDILVAVNGETIRIKRGETVKIKRKFLNALNDASKQQYAAYQSSVKAQEQGKKPLANM